MGQDAEVTIDVQTEDYLDAVDNNDVKATRLLLECTVNVNALRAGQTGLIIAAGNGNLDMVQLLVAHKADVNLVDTDLGTTALMMAAEGGYLDVVGFLLSKGAKVNPEDRRGKSALAYAMRQGHKQVIETLKQAGARSTHPRTVLVTGAGFTKAFMPGAPLLVDDYAVTPALTTKYLKMHCAYKVLKDELERHKDISGTEKRVDLEQLMTRLVGGMPYDCDLRAQHELANLLEDIKLHFLKKMEQAKEGTLHRNELHDLARVCIVHQIQCISFNYDDIFDEALWHTLHPSSGIGGWSPNTGYGFFCRSSEDCIGEPWRQPIYDESSMQLLKLHGSINWRVRLGATEPFRIEDIVHHTPWYLYGTRGCDADGKPCRYRDNCLPKADFIVNQLENEPFIVPPILAKASLNHEPLLRRLWLHAYHALQQAERVIFVGYSLPITDIAASFLFAEAVPPHCNPPEVYVVDFDPTGDEQKQQGIKNAYRRIYRDVPDDHFRFDGGRKWAQDFVIEHGGVEGVLKWASDKDR